MSCKCFSIDHDAGYVIIHYMMEGWTVVETTVLHNEVSRFILQPS